MENDINSFEQRIENWNKQLVDSKRRLKIAQNRIDYLRKERSALLQGELPPDERQYSELSLRIKIKNLEIACIGLSSCISLGETEINKLQLERELASGHISQADYDDFLGQAEADYWVSMYQFYSESYVEQNDLLSMRNIMLALKCDRGEISRDDKLSGQEENNFFIQRNDEYDINMQTTLNNARKGQIELRIKSANRQGHISNATRDAQLDELYRTRVFTDSTLEQIMSIRVDEYEDDHAPSR